MRLLETTTWVSFLLAFALIGGIAGGLWLAQPLLADMGRASLLLFFVVIVGACVFIGVPIAFAFGNCHLLVSGADHDHAAGDCRQPHG